MIRDGLHILPVDDLMEHDLCADCFCGPRISVEPDPDGQYGWIYVHAFLDGREQAE